jgi:hypothetical protein
MDVILTRVVSLHISFSSVSFAFNTCLLVAIRFLKRNIFVRFQSYVLNAVNITVRWMQADDSDRR